MGVVLYLRPVAWRRLVMYCRPLPFITGVVLYCRPVAWRRVVLYCRPVALQETTAGLQALCRRCRSRSAGGHPPVSLLLLLVSPQSVQCAVCSVQCAV